MESAGVKLARLDRLSSSIKFEAHSSSVGIDSMMDNSDGAKKGLGASGGGAGGSGGAFDSAVEASVDAALRFVRKLLERNETLYTHWTL